jgi:uncharacterized protein YlzI (FlbEa/FlbD family)
MENIEFAPFTLADGGMNIAINRNQVTAIATGNHQTTIYVVGGQKFTVAQDLDAVYQLFGIERNVALGKTA